MTAFDTWRVMAALGLGGYALLLATGGALALRHGNRDDEEIEHVD